MLHFCLFRCVFQIELRATPISNSLTGANHQEFLFTGTLPEFLLIIVLLITRDQEALHSHGRKKNKCAINI